MHTHMDVAHESDIKSQSLSAVNFHKDAAGLKWDSMYVMCDVKSVRMCTCASLSLFLFTSIAHAALPHCFLTRAQMAGHISHISRACVCNFCVVVCVVIISQVVQTQCEC